MNNNRQRKREAKRFKKYLEKAKRSENSYFDT